MAENPLVRVGTALPSLRSANALRRRVEGRIRSIDMLRWDGVRYGDHPRQILHIWELNDLCPRDGWPAVLLIHGGGWRTGSRMDFESFAPAFARRGVLAAAMEYRLAPECRWPAQRDDVLAALGFLAQQQVDTDRIALWGHSAGGQMALVTALEHPDRVRCAVALGAPFDLRAIAGSSPDPLEEIFDPDALESASPQNIRGESAPPILLVHGERDRVCPVEGARAFAAGRPGVDLIEVPAGDHGLRWPIIGCLRAKRRAVDWVMAQLAPAPRGSKWRRQKKKK